jgi:hypothetical protein
MAMKLPKPNPKAKPGRAGSYGKKAKAPKQVPAKTAWPTQY